MKWRFWEKLIAPVTVHVQESDLTSAKSYYVQGPDEATTLRVLKKIRSTQEDSQN